MKTTGESSFRSPSGSACQADTSDCHPTSTDHVPPPSKHVGVSRRYTTYSVAGSSFRSKGLTDENSREWRTGGGGGGDVEGLIGQTRSGRKRGRQEFSIQDNVIQNAGRVVPESTQIQARSGSGAQHRWCARRESTPRSQIYSASSSPDSTSARSSTSWIAQCQYFSRGYETQSSGVASVLSSTRRRQDLCSNTITMPVSHLEK